jgi:hypothetical protein
VMKVVARGNAGPLSVEVTNGASVSLVVMIVYDGKMNRVYR